MFGPCDRVALVSFADHAQQVTPLAPLGLAARQGEFRRAVLTHVRANGGTNITRALRLAGAMLQGAHIAQPARAHIAANGRPRPCRTGQARLESGLRASSAGSPPIVSTFGYGSNHDATTLAELASWPRARSPTLTEWTSWMNCSQPIWATQQASWPRMSGCSSAPVRAPPSPRWRPLALGAPRMRRAAGRWRPGRASTP